MGAGQVMPRPNVEALLFDDPRFPGRQVGLLGFYHPGHDEEWDTLCGCGFLGNFFEIGQDQLLICGPRDGQWKFFSNAESAFQSLKFWDYAEQFRRCTGGQAFRLKQSLEAHPHLIDRTYCGFGSNWAAMRHVLQQKFADDRSRQCLFQTAPGFLLEHNATTDRDKVWSNNHIGDGTNWLGMQLMLLRDELAGQSTWSDFIVHHCQLDIHTGMHVSQNGARAWQDVVQSATNVLLRCFSPGTGLGRHGGRGAVPRCLRPSCGKGTWNGLPREYCSKDCRDASRIATHRQKQPSPPAVAKCPGVGCHKPSWNGRHGEYCSIVCRDHGRGVQAQHGTPTMPRASQNYPTSGASSRGYPSAHRHQPSWK